MNKYLIINADDFGLNKNINQGIIQAYQAGIVTSASLLINQAGLAHALDLCQKNPHLDIGVHLNIFRGRPLSRYLRHLINQQGFFLNRELFLLKKILFHSPKIISEIRQEFSAQIETALFNNIKVSHLDTEKNLHILPSIFQIIVELAHRYAIPAIRFPFEKLTETNRSFIKRQQFIKIKFSHLFASHNCRIVKEAALKTAKFFHGISLTKNCSLANLKKSLIALPPGTHEFSCHPGYDNDWREAELKTLINPEIKKTIANCQIQLINFKNL